MAASAELRSEPVTQQHMELREANRMPRLAQETSDPLPAPPTLFASLAP